MADINNENTINEKYRTNVKQLWNFVMVKFNRDTVVIPRESEWFGFYNDGMFIFNAELTQFFSWLCSW